MVKRSRPGIIGGMGPMATALFLKMIIEMTDARTDQEHVDLVIEHCPGIPDRTAFILGESKADPFPMILAAGRHLIEAGADQIVIPCVTAHYFRERLEQILKVPLMDGVEETAAALHEMGVQSAGILATEGTVRAGIFEDAMRRQGIRTIYPEAGLQKQVTALIFDRVKAGRGDDGDALVSVVTEMKRSGAEAVVLGCTELSVLADGQTVPADCADVLRILARSVVMRYASLKGDPQ